MGIQLHWVVVGEQITRKLLGTKRLNQLQVAGLETVDSWIDGMDVQVAGLGYLEAQLVMLGDDWVDTAEAQSSELGLAQWHLRNWSCVKLSQVTFIPYIPSTYKSAQRVLAVYIVPWCQDTLLKVVSAGWQSSGNTGNAEFWIDGHKLDVHTSRGLNVVALNTEMQMSANGTFDTWLYQEASNEFAAFIENVPTGHIVLVAVCDEATTNLNQVAKAAFKDIGTSHFPEGFRWPYAVIGVKGANVPAWAYRQAPRVGIGASERVEIEVHTNQHCVGSHDPAFEFSERSATLIEFGNDLTFL